MDIFGDKDIFHLPRCQKKFSDLRFQMRGCWWEIQRGGEHEGEGVTESRQRESCTEHSEVSHPSLACYTCNLPCKQTAVTSQALCSLPATPTCLEIFRWASHFHDYLNTRIQLADLFKKFILFSLFKKDYYIFSRLELKQFHHLWGLNMKRRSGSEISSASLSQQGPPSSGPAGLHHCLQILTSWIQGPLELLWVPNLPGQMDWVQFTFIAFYLETQPSPVCEGRLWESESKAELTGRLGTKTWYAPDHPFWWSVTDRQ